MPDTEGSTPRREWRYPASVRLAVSTAIIAGTLGAVLASGLTAAYDRRHPADGTGASVVLTQTGAAPSGSTAPGSVADIAAAALPSVVTVVERTSTLRGTGSGVVIDGPRGLILTNNHVVADARAQAGSGGRVQVIASGGSMADALAATIVGTDGVDDLAVLRVASTALKTATLGRSGSLRVGDGVVAIGAPLGLAGTVTTGIVSYLGRNVAVPGDTATAADNTLTGAIQTDAAINPGNSGGPLLDSGGRVIGIDSAIASTGAESGGAAQSGNIGLGFAIPIDEAVYVAAELIRAPHTATHPFLGVRTQDSLAPAGARLSSVTSGTVTLPAVAPGSPAQRAGLREGDVITALGGDRVADADDLLAAVRRHRVGETVTVSFLRGGRAATTPVSIGDSGVRG